MRANEARAWSAWMENGDDASSTLSHYGIGSFAQIDSKAPPFAHTFMFTLKSGFRSGPVDKEREREREQTMVS